MIETDLNFRQFGTNRFDIRLIDTACQRCFVTSHCLLIVLKILIDQAHHTMWPGIRWDQFSQSFQMKNGRFHRSQIIQSCPSPAVSFNVAWLAPHGFPQHLRGVQ